MLNGFINLYKSPQMSSNRALSILKRTLKENNIITKVGHFGTLDPIAEGVLPVALGRATRLFDYTIDKVKKYRAIFKFGVETDTLDSSGSVISTGRNDVTKEEIEKVIPNLVGTIQQIPPKYSAKVVGGQRAYQLARKGKEFVLQPKEVVIYSIKIIEKLDIGTFLFDIECGGGTYIRSIVRDIAFLLGTVGIMTSLIRTASGPFTVENSIKIDDLSKNLTESILPIDFLLGDYPVVNLDEKQFFKVNNGLFEDMDGVNSIDHDVVIYTPDNRLMGIGKVFDGQISIKTWLL